MTKLHYVMFMVMIVALVVVVKKGCCATLPSLQPDFAQDIVETFSESFTEFPVNTSATERGSIPQAATILKDNVSELANSLQSHKSMIKQQRDQLAVQLSDMQTTEAKLADVQKKLEQAGQSTSEVTAERDALQTEMAQVKTKMDEMQEMLRYLELSTDSLEETFDVNSSYAFNSETGNPTSANTAECESKCASDTACVAFTSNTGNTDCFLHTSTPTSATFSVNMVGKIKRSKNVGSTIYGRVPADTVKPMHVSQYYHTANGNSTNDAIVEAKAYATSNNITGYKMIKLKYGNYGSTGESYEYSFYADTVPKSQLVVEDKSFTHYVA